MLSFPPTGDSLYKYATAGGLALLFASCSLEIGTWNTLVHDASEAGREMQMALLEVSWRAARANELRGTYPGLSELVGDAIRPDPSDPSWTERLATRDLQPAECTRNVNARVNESEIPCAVVAEMRQIEKEFQEFHVNSIAWAAAAAKLGVASMVGIVVGIVGSALGFIIFLAGLIGWYLTHQLPHDLRVAQELLHEKKRNKGAKIDKSYS